MNPILDAAVEIDRFCTDRGLEFCIIGGLAVLRWGQPRLTRDVDVTIVTGFGGEESVIEVLLEQFRARFDDAREFALRNRVLLVRASNTVPIDIALGALPFERRAARRASRWVIQENLDVLTCGPEDLVVHKVFAGRDQDWLDVSGVIDRNGASLDRELIRSELTPLLELKGTTAQLARVDEMFARS